MRKNKKKPRFLAIKGTVLGLDEAGRGPLAGPLVCAAVILPQRIRLKGLNDCKLLIPLHREILFQKISKKCAFGVGTVSAGIIDRLGLIKACEKAFKKAFFNLKKKIGKITPSIILVDGNDNFDFPFPYQSVIKGDRKVRAIAAASIIAKVHRDRLMIRMAKKYPEYMFEKHKGYGTRLHKMRLKRFGPSEIHRKSFRPVNSYV